MTATYDDIQKRSWLLYLLIACAILALPLSVRTARWFPAADRLVYAALWGAVVGLLLARSSLPHWLSWCLSIVLGMQYALIFAGELLPGIHIVFQDVEHLIGWLWQLVAYRSLGTRIPFGQSTSHFVRQATEMLSNLTTWLATIRAGEASTDITALKIIVAFVIWLVTWNATYELFSRRRVFVALLPLGTIIVLNTSYTGIGLAYVHFFLFTMLLLLVRGSLERMEIIWENLGLDFSYELRRDATFAGIFLSSAILIIALVMPYMTYNRAVFFFWERVGPTLEEFYDDLDRAFAGRDPVPESTPEEGLGAHSITAGDTLGEDIVFLVETSDPAPPPEEELMMLEGTGIDYFVPKRYWRERTYDLYTGHGWDSSERNTRTVDADHTWKEINFPHEPLTQTFELQDTKSFGFGVNEPVHVEQEYQIITRGDEDLAAFSVEEDTFTVISHVPEATEEELRAAEKEYPDWIKERYLQLSDDIPDRVSQEAQRVVEEAEGTTRYDKARAIEAYIRRFEYTEDLDPPSLDTDIVDYFLFTAQRGYCDYSATAMVVMLRSVGVASRYASGYGMGDYNHAEGAWVVRQRNAHAWTEVYFPGYGWIEFEPTPTQSIFSHAGTDVGSVDLPDPEPQEQTQERAIPPLFLWAGGLVLVVLLVIIWPFRWIGAATDDPRQRVWKIYDKIVRRGRWVGFGPHDGQTPREYLNTLASQIENHTGFEAQGDIGTIRESYLKALYSESPISEQEYHRTTAAFKRIRGKLLRLVFVRHPHTTASS